MDMRIRKTYIWLSVFLPLGIGLMLFSHGCDETICPDSECLECPQVDSLKLTEMGEKMKVELEQLFLDIEDLALLRVYNCTGDTCYWSGFDAGDPQNDSRQIQLEFLECEMIAIFKRFEDGRWTNSYVRVPYDFVVAYVLQQSNFVNSHGQIFRRANNVLIYLKDGTCPEVDGSDSVDV